MKYILIIAALLAAPAYAVVNPTGKTWTSGDLTTCGDGSLNTNCAPTLAAVTANCTAPTARSDTAALPQSEISHYILQAKDTTNDFQIVKIITQAGCGDVSAYLRTGSWTVRMKTVDTVGRVSVWSNSVAVVIP